MNNTEYFIYLLIIAGSTFLIRAIPFVAVKEKIKNRYVQSFLYYIPYAVLTAMTIPSIFYAPNMWLAAMAALIVAVILALKDRGLMTVAVVACLVVFIVEIFI